MKTTGEMEHILRQQGLLRDVMKFGKDDRESELFGLTYDSREVNTGTLFICKGSTFRAEYLEEAIRRGCAAFLMDEQTFEEMPDVGQMICKNEITGIWMEKNKEGQGGPVNQTEQDCSAGHISEDIRDKKNRGSGNRIVTGLVVTDIRKAMAAVSAVFYDYCPGKPKLTGITGTKGKTTTAWYLKAMLDLWQKEQGGKETGLISTVENYDGTGHQEAVMTTPEAPVIHKYLANAREKGLSHMTMEVSSQALKYKRVRGMQFQVGIFLNISEDHISPQEHVDFEDYFSAKLSMLRQTGTACINLDCEHTDRILKAARKSGRIVTFGAHQDADIRYSNMRLEEKTNEKEHCIYEINAEASGCVNGAEGGIKNSNGGRHLTFQVTCDRFTEQFSLAMRGCFNIENAMAAIAAAYVYGVPVHCMKQALAETTVPGRMESFISKDGKICGLVDFAHNRLSFERLFDAVYGEYSAYRNIITVFGCPGGKALNRRRELGIIAGLFSDYVCITSDSPGVECQAKIAGEIRNYVEMTGCPCSCVAERKEAVRYAVSVAAQNSEPTLILVLGRGSERFQKIGNQTCAYPKDANLVEQAIGEYDQNK